ncbi:MAG: protein-glutamate O-methyltransferase CheR [Bacteroidetes bacterium]|nr:protein-glutamate O-methyltransferase CheR [Bacteroidota bacterium]
MKDINQQLADLLSQSYDVDISKYDASFLNNAVNKRLAETQSNSVTSYCEFLQKNNPEVALFLNSLHICYTEFFRNSLTFSVLERIILPSLMMQRNSSEIRIWTAACASGQESYSIAMLMEELKNGDREKYNYRLFATDQDARQVNLAKKGQYSDVELNNLNLKRVKQWFTKHGEIYSVKPELKARIDFSVFDLFNEELCCPTASIFGDFDLVICANLLFYYKHEYRKKILEKVGSCLTRGGYLVTGETERDILLEHNFAEVYPHSAIFRKI